MIKTSYAVALIVASILLSGCGTSTFFTALQKAKADRMMAGQDFEVCGKAEDVKGSLKEAGNPAGILGSAVEYAKTGQCDEEEGNFRLLALATKRKLRGKVMNLSRGESLCVEGEAVDVYGADEFAGSYFLVDQVYSSGEKSPLQAVLERALAAGLIPGTVGHDRTPGDHALIVVVVIRSSGL